MSVETPCGLCRQPLHTHSGGQDRDVRRGQRTEIDRGPGLSARHSAQPLGEPRRGLAALREQRQHALSDEAACHEQKRPERVHIGPLRIVDDDGHRGLLLHILDHLEDPGADPNRFLGGKRPVAAGEQPRVAHACGAHQLIYHPVGDKRFPLLTGGPQHSQIRHVGEEMVQHRRFPHPARTFEEDQARMTRPDGLKLDLQRVDLTLTSDEGSGALADRHGVLLRGVGGRCYR